MGRKKLQMSDQTYPHFYSSTSHCMTGCNVKGLFAVLYVANRVSLVSLVCLGEVRFVGKRHLSVRRFYVINGKRWRC